MLIVAIYSLSRCYGIVVITPNGVNISNEKFSIKRDCFASESEVIVLEMNSFYSSSQEFFINDSFGKIIDYIENKIIYKFVSSIIISVSIHDFLRVADLLLIREIKQR